LLSFGKNAHFFFRENDLEPVGCLPFFARTNGHAVNAQIQTFDPALASILFPAQVAVVRNAQSPPLIEGDGIPFFSQMPGEEGEELETPTRLIPVQRGKHVLAFESEELAEKLVGAHFHSGSLRSQVVDSLSVSR